MNLEVISLTRLETQSSGADFADEMDNFNEVYGEAGEGPWIKVNTPDPDKSSTSSNLACMEARGVASVLEDLQAQLIILRYVMGGHHIQTQKKGLPEECHIFPEGNNIPVLSDAAKLETERSRLEQIVTATIKALTSQLRTFLPLLTAARRYTREREEDKALVEETRENLERAKDVRGCLDRLREQEKEERLRGDEYLYKLEDETDYLRLKISLQETLVSKWEKSRSDQNKWKLKYREEVLKRRIAESTERVEQENRASTEMQTLISIDSKELRDKLEDWITKYDDEMEERNNRIIQLNYNKEMQLALIKDNKRLYEERGCKIQEWITFKEETTTLISAIIVIQAWWRATMVRYKLGPYRPKQKKKKKLKKMEK